MTNQDFRAWRTSLGWTQAIAAAQLGLSKPTIENYERGTRRDNGDEVVIPKYIALACAALHQGIEPWSRPMEGS